MPSRQRKTRRSRCRGTMPGQQQAVNGGEDVDGVALMVEQRARRKADEDVVEPRVEDVSSSSFWMFDL